MAFIDTAKKMIGISTTRMDDVISTEIEAAKARMRMSGVDVVDVSDTLTETAIGLYLRGLHNYGGQGERWREAFEATVRCMATASEYKEA